MSARMSARFWPDSLFGRLAIILFSGLVAAHVLAFVLIALDRIAITDDLGDKFTIVDIADSVAILDYVKPEERPAGSTASLDTISIRSQRWGGWKRSHSQTTASEHRAFANPAGARPRREFCLLRSTDAIATGHAHSSERR